MVCLSESALVGEEAEFLELTPAIYINQVARSSGLQFRLDHLDELDDAGPYEPTFANLASNRITQNTLRNHIGNEGA